MEMVASHPLVHALGGGREWMAWMVVCVEEQIVRQRSVGTAVDDAVEVRMMRSGVEEEGGGGGGVAG